MDRRLQGVRGCTEPLRPRTEALRTDGPPPVDPHAEGMVIPARRRVRMRGGRQTTALRGRPRSARAIRPGFGPELRENRSKKLGHFGVPKIRGGVPTKYMP